MELLRLLDGDEGGQKKVPSKGFYQILLPSKVVFCHDIHVRERWISISICVACCGRYVTIVSR